MKAIQFEHYGRPWIISALDTGTRFSWLLHGVKIVISICAKHPTRDEVARLNSILAFTLGVSFEITHKL
jgi:hypothetical protein